jgi:hypothetical protein
MHSARSRLFIALMQCLIDDILVFKVSGLGAQRVLSYWLKTGERRSDAPMNDAFDAVRRSNNGPNECCDAVISSNNAAIFHYARLKWCRGGNEGMIYADQRALTDRFLHLCGLVGGL